jgi:hypothetical protein
VIEDIEGKFFRLMSSIVSFVARAFSRERRP